MAADVKVDEKPSLCLDSTGCVSLQEILVAFNAPISEEHAWALCFECVNCFRNALQEHGKCLVVSEPEHVILHKDGQVHVRTVLDTSSPSPSTKNDGTRPFTSSEQKLVFHLGLTLFRALEFGFQEEEERRLGADLERLIDFMTAEQASGEEARPETDDEGIEQDSCEGADDSAPQRGGSTSTAGTSSMVCNDSGPLHVVLTRVLEHCTTRQTGGRGQAESHYRAVCRALVAEALELASFLERVSQGTQSLPCVQVDPDNCRDLDQLKFADWARLWMQVIQELRHGVQLKKVRDAGCAPCVRGGVNPASIEYELTPYEILMDDIRARRYKLNKVMVDGEIPQRVKKDAHAIILEFIRSRPPLRKASERKLGPAPNRASSPRELLMESIKQEHRLRPSLSPAKRLTAESLPAQTGPSLQEPRKDEGTPMRRLIQVDFSEFQGDIEDDDEDLICSIDSPTSPTVAGSVTTPARHPNPWRRTDSTSSTTSAAGSHLKLRYDLGDLLAGSRASGFLTGETATVADPVLENVAVEGAGRPASLLLDSYDLATQCPSRRATLRRRHTVATTATTEEDDTNVTNGTDDVPVKKVANVSDPERGEEAEEEEEDSRTHTSLGSCELNWSRSSLQDELLQSSHWQSAMECLSLTLEEIVHIRSVLTKAELESLPVEGRIKEEVEKRKVCFLCLKTRFSIFGPWGQRCKLCKRTVCAKCCSKMRIPTEHFSRVPVFALSPGLSSPEGSEDGSNSPTFARSLMTRLLNPSASSTAPTATATSTPPAPQRYNSVGSAPTSPASVRRSKPGTTDPPNSMTPSPAHQQFHPTISPNIEEQPQSLPVTVNNKETSAQRGKLLRSKTLGRPAGVCNTTTAEKLKGLQMTVCLDCKAMVLQIIKTSRTSRTHAIKNLSLNLSPVY